VGVFCRERTVVVVVTGGSCLKDELSWSCKSVGVLVERASKLVLVDCKEGGLEIPIYRSSMSSFLYLWIR
jgi:hypothetical protein